MIRRVLTLLAGACVWTTAVGAHPVPRTVLLETFTNVSCAGCADANPVTRSVMDAHGRHVVLNVQYHGNWPHPADPFYLPVADAVNDRLGAYGVMNFPDLFTCGEDRPYPADLPGLEAAVAAARAELTPLRLEVDLLWAGQTAVVSVGVQAVAEPPGDYRTLRIALVDESETIVPAPGTNGETEFSWTLRRFLPDVDGTPFLIAPGDSLVFTRMTPADPAWDLSDIHAVAWIQDDLTGEILQAGGSLPPPAIAFDWYAEEAAALVPMNTFHRSEGWLENLGTTRDTYHLSLASTTPGWPVSACAGFNCYPPWVTEFDVSLEPGEEKNVSVDVTPQGTPGTGVVTLTAVSDADPSLVVTRTFTYVSTGAEVLLVDADPDRPYQTYLQVALTAAGADHVLWKRAEHGPLTAADYAAFPTVIWDAGQAVPALDDADRAALGDYLDQGGRLLFSGQDLAYSLCQPGAPGQTPAAAAWFAEYTGAGFVADDAYSAAVTGRVGDPLGDGLSFAIAGGDGADNQDYPDELSAAPNARGCLEYAPGRPAAVRFGRGDARIVTLGFGFEGVDTDAHRTLLLQRILAWFADTTVGVDPAPDAPDLALSAAPNPFNPSVRLRSQGEGPASLRIRDLQGRLVRTLLVDAQPGVGLDADWDGHDDLGRRVSAGVYFAHLETPAGVRVLKLTLVK